MAETRGTQTEAAEGRNDQPADQSEREAVMNRPDSGSDGQREAPSEPDKGKEEDEGHKPWLIIAGVIIVILALFFGIRYWLFARDHVSTDDAYVTGNLVNVSPLISGTLVHLYVDEGQFVHKNQLIARLDDSGSRATLRQAQANYQAALSAIPTAQRNLIYQQLETRAEIAKARASLSSQQAKTAGAQQQVTLTSAIVQQQISQATASMQASEAEAFQADSQVASAAASRDNSRQAVDTARAALANYAQQVQTAVRGADAAVSRVTAAQVEADQSARDATRYQLLYNQDAISAQAYEQAATQAKNEAAQLNAARSEAAQSDSQVASARAAAAQARSQVVQAQRAAQQSEAQLAAAKKAAQAAHDQVGVYRAGLALARANAAQVGIQQSNLRSTAQQTGASQADVASAEAGKQQVAIRQKQIATYEAQAQQARAALTNAEITLDDTYIYSPCDGEVVRKDSNEGATMSPGSTIVTVAQKTSTNDIWIEANFKETQLQDVRVGEPAEIDVDAVGGKTFRGRVQSIMEATGAATALLPPDNATGNFTKVVQRIPVRIQLLPAGPGDPKDDATADDIMNLRQGMSVTATIDVSNYKNYPSGQAWRYGRTGGTPPQGTPGAAPSAGASLSQPGVSPSADVQPGGQGSMGPAQGAPGITVAPEQPGMAPSGSAPNTSIPIPNGGQPQPPSSQTAPQNGSATPTPPPSTPTVPESPGAIPGFTGSTAGNAAAGPGSQSPSQGPAAAQGAGGGGTAGGGGH